MLWKKESQSHDALYVDFFAPCISHWESKVNDLLRTIDQKPHPTKSDEIALQKRNEGNEKFRECKWLDAMELYGDSLRFAEPKSEHISLAYANRAACFLNLKMYENCLKDIELANEAEYPKHLIPKLDQRKKNCMQQMQEDPQTERELRIESDEQFPCLANVAEVRKNENGGYSIIAKTDIDIGQIIGIEEPFQKCVFGKFGLTCNTCLKEYGNLVACAKCARVMFCPDCKDDDWLHKYECGLNFCENDSSLNRLAMKIVRYSLQTIKAFPSIDDLMAFIEQCHKNPTQWPENLLDEQSKYRLFFIKTNNRRKKIDDQVQCTTYCAFQTLLRIPQINQLFQSEKHQRFLMHLIAHQFSWYHHANRSACIIVGMEKYFKHSCDPNIGNCIYDGKLISYAVKLIQEGEELNLCQIPYDIAAMGTTEERQKKLLDLGYEKCECARCNGKMASPEQDQQMSNDPAYTESVAHTVMLLMTNKANEVNAAKTMDDCARFLRTHSRMDYCTVMGSVKTMFQHLYEVSLTKDINHPLTRARLLKRFDEYFQSL